MDLVGSCRQINYTQSVMMVAVLAFGKVVRALSKRAFDVEFETEKGSYVQSVLHRPPV